MVFTGKGDDLGKVSNPEELPVNPKAQTDREGTGGMYAGDASDVERQIYLEDRAIALTLARDKARDAGEDFDDETWLKQYDDEHDMDIEGGVQESFNPPPDLPPDTPADPFEDFPPKFEQLGVVMANVTKCVTDAKTATITLNVKLEEPYLGALCTRAGKDVMILLAEKPNPQGDLFDGNVATTAGEGSETGSDGEQDTPGD